MNLKLIIFKAFKMGICLNILAVFMAVAYVFIVEYYACPFVFKPPLQLGTAVSGGKIFNTSDGTNFTIRPAWAKIESNFDLFLPEFQLRSDWKQPSPRLEKWCKIRNCCAHRIGFSDLRIANFKCFTLDDWYLTNRDFLGSDLDNAVISSLNSFLIKLPRGSRVIISEPYVLFADRRSFHIFTSWVLGLRSKYPALHFEIGVQIHLQSIDSYWFQYQWLIPALSQFSRQHRVPWGISEFSIYDRQWKSRIAYGGVRPERSYLIERVEGFFPDRLRRAVVLHQSYLIHRYAVGHGATFIIEWANFPVTWFASAIDSDYRSTFALFDWDGNAQMMYWAVMRGLQDGKN